MRLQVVDTRGEQIVYDLEATSDTTLGHIKERICELWPHRQCHRQHLYKMPERHLLSKDEATFKEAGIADSCTLMVKDIGPQIEWRTVFIIEYLGPLLIHLFAAYACYPRLHRKAILFAAMNVLHFTKREYETLFVHRFSHATMPWRNLVKNCSYYWTIGALLPCYFLYTNDTFCSASLSASTDYLLMGLWMAMQYLNYKTHCTLRDLRPAGSKERKIPYGWGFDYFVCPNYVYEVTAWLCVAFYTRHWSSFLFCALGAYQMMVWAKQKEKQYKKDFGTAWPAHRRVLLILT